MKKLKQFLALLLITVMVFSGSISDVSMLTSFAATEETQTEESVPGASEDDAKEEQSEETPADTSDEDQEKQEEDRQGTTEEPSEKKDDAQTTEEPEAPGEEAEDTLKQREIKAELIKEALYKDVRKEKKTKEYRNVNSLWKSLTGRKASSEADDLTADVTVAGNLPDGVTAKARYIRFDEGAVYTERGLFSLDITLYDKDGKKYIPEEPVTVTVKGNTLKEELEDDNALLVYSYEKAAERAEDYSDKYDKTVYAADVSVYKSEDVNKKLLSYEVYDKDEKYKNGEDAVRYTNEKEELDCDKDSISFIYDYADKAKSAENQEPSDKIEIVVTSQMAKDTFKTQVGDVEITVTGALDKDVILRAEEITKKDNDYKDYINKTADAINTSADDLSFARAFDIKLIDPETGEEFEPDSTVKVSVNLKDEDVSKADSVNVAHFADGKDKKPDVMDATTKGTTVKFSTGGFSVYVIYGEQGEVVTPRRTYRFYVKNDDDAWDLAAPAQKVRSGQKPVIPQPIVKEAGKMFAGWYEHDNQGKPKADPYDFNTPVAEDEDIDLYAEFEDCAYVVFHDQYSEKVQDYPIADTRWGALDETTHKTKVKISDISTTYNDGNDMAFYGWSYTKIKVPGSATDENGDHVSKIEPDADGCIEISENKDLYPIYKPIKWLTYWSGPTGSGATYYPAQYFYDGVGPDKLPVPERSGYTFLGWYAGTIDSTTEVVTYGTVPLSTDDGSLIPGAGDGGMSVYDGHLHLSDNATLYAMWDDDVDYQILVWKQKTTDTPGLSDDRKTYELDVENSDTRKAAIGSTVSVPAEFKNLAFDGYTYSRCDADTAVSANGDTVLNVYYDCTVLPYEPSQTPQRTLTYADSVTGTGASAMPAAEQHVYGAALSDPASPSSSRAHYTFDKWYADPSCNVAVFLHTPTADDLDPLKIMVENPATGKEEWTGKYKPYVVYDTMPDHDLTIYAGWEAEWFLVEIDPNYGAMYEYNDAHQLVGSGATWFWEDYNGQPIQEYQHVTRDYVESSSGTWYYVKHDQAYYGSGPVGDRYTYYTQDPSEATEYTTFEKAPNVYRYAGWYEKKADGSEEPYDFSRRVDHDTSLILHWKKVGNYYLKYAAGEGTIDNGTEKEVLDENCYADNASVVVVHSAKAPDGYTFAGWKIQGDTSDTVYGPGELITLKADYAVSISGKETITLEAVYKEIETATIIYDFNGGTAGAGFDFGSPADHEAPTPVTKVATDGKSAEISNLVNNEDFVISNGNGLTRENAVFKGWSTSSTYDPEKDVLFEPGETYGVDTEEPVRIYAVWAVDVTYHLNIPDNPSLDPAKFSWGGPWEGYTLATVGSEEVYKKEVYLGNAVDAPVDIPEYADGTIFFRYWAEEPEGITPYDFTQPVNGATDLYVSWSEAINIPLHVIDSSEETLQPVDEWLKTYPDPSYLMIGTERLDLDDTLAGGFVTLPDDKYYQYAFAVALERDTDVATASISEEDAISSVYYDQTRQHVYVGYVSEGKADALLDETKDIYFIYYEKKELGIAYRSMDLDGVIDNENPVAVSALAPQTTTLNDPATEDDYLGNFDMNTSITAPLAWATPAGQDPPYGYYAYSVGIDNASDVTDLSVLSDSSDSDDERPDLKVKNTWRGFRYSIDNGNTWLECGFNVKLYVIYFDQKPTVINFHERTVGTMDMIGATSDTGQRFEYHIHVEDSTGKVVYDSLESGQTYSLKDGEEASAVIFYNYNGGSPVTQTITITQLPLEGEHSDDYRTTVDDGDSETETTVWGPYESTEEGGTKDITFINTDKEEPVEVHVACIQNGEVILCDNLRSVDPTDYRFMLPITESENIKDKLPPADVYSDSFGKYAFGAVVYGTDNGENGSTVTIKNMGVEFVEYGQIQDNHYELLLKNSSGAKLDELGQYHIYYLYYPMPTIQYIKQSGEGDSAELTRIMGSLDGTNPDTTITYGGERIYMNGVQVVQDQRVAVPANGLKISQATGQANFKMPPVLDDETYQRYLKYSSIAVGTGISSGGSQYRYELGENVSDDCEMELKIQNNNTLSWSFNGTNWHPFAETNVIYAIYTERGYDFQLSKIVDTSESKPNPIFTNRVFTVTISSESIVPDKDYSITGWSSTKVHSTADGEIILDVMDGTKVKINALPRGEYTVTESDNENFALTVKSGPIVGEATTDEIVNNDSFTITLDTEKQVVLTNKPKAICKIIEGSEDILFYTLKDAVDYVIDTYSDGTATIEMLCDYLVPAEDTLDIPGTAHITLTTATTGTHRYDGTGKAELTRGDHLADDSMVNNNGELKLINITLDGKDVQASKPLIQSSGKLTVDRGTTIQNAKNSGNGGAISASGTVEVTGADTVVLRNNQAAKGGLLYYTGPGTGTHAGPVTISGESTNISGNRAEEGGAIYATVGDITISGGSISGNGTGSGITTSKGGVIYSEKAEVEISGGNVTGNNAGSGAVVYSEDGSVTVSGGTVNGNTATENGGAVCTESGSISVSGGSVNNNTAAENGGALYSGSGNVTVSGGSVNSNTATEGAGGAIYTQSGDVSISKAGTTVNSNTAGQGGGAVYAGSGSVSIADASVSSNTATNGNGGAVCAGTGNVTVSSGNIGSNSASNGNGGAVYNESGEVNVSGGTIGGDGTGNSAVKGSAIYIGSGNATFSGGSITYNNATGESGAVEVGTETCKLTFSGNIIIRYNTKTGEEEEHNVYLSHDTDAVINTGGISSGDKNVGIYVPGDKDDENSLFNSRGNVGCEFGIFTGSSGTTVPAFRNDREENLTAVIDQITRRIYWSGKLSVQVRYLGSYANGLPNGTNGDAKYTNENYYPAAGNKAISVLAEELRGKCSNLSATSVYATALLGGDPDYDHYLTRLIWDEGQWKVEKRSGGDAVAVGTSKIIIYYSEPAYMSIENNTEFDLNITDLSINVNNTIGYKSVLNSNTVAGLGLVFAKDGYINEELLPVQKNSDGVFVLDAASTDKVGGSVTILIPGCRNMSYRFNGNFTDGTGNVKERITKEGQPTEFDEYMIPADQTVNIPRGTETRKTLNSSKFYQIIFGEDKYICKIVRNDNSLTGADGKYPENAGDGEDTEYLFTKMTHAVEFATNNGITDPKIEMLIDYLMPATDVVSVTNANGFASFELTTAKDGYYLYDAEKRATLSRGDGNTLAPMILVSSTDITATYVNVHDLDFDGKTQIGTCDGGALKTINCKVDVLNSDYKNFISSNGGALFISYGTETGTGTNSRQYKFDNYDPANLPYYTFTLSNAKFNNNEARSNIGRAGGGAVWTNANLFEMDHCDFDTCIADASVQQQGGAVFHRIESQKLTVTPYNPTSTTRIDYCTFTGCKSKAGGAVETDARDVYFDNSTFTSCSTTTKDGGAINIYIYEQNLQYCNISSNVHINKCDFVSCTANRSGGAIRTLATDTYISNCTFTNTTANGSDNGSGGPGGGAIFANNKYSNVLSIDGCTFNGAVITKGYGGAVYSASKYVDINNTTISGCKAMANDKGYGGAVYHLLDYGYNKITDAHTILDNCTITGCTARQYGGGLYSNACIVNILNGTLFQNCTAETKQGGGVFTYYEKCTSSTIENSKFENCSAAQQGGGLYNGATDLVISGTEFTSCSSGTNGGGVFHSKSDSTVTFNDTMIESCTATQSGGGIYVEKSKNNSVSYTGGYVKKCTAGSDGGGIYLTANISSITLNGTEISGNEAGGKGGGAYLPTTFKLINVTVTANKLSTNNAQNAAGIYMTDSGTFEIGTQGAGNKDNTVIMNNTTHNGTYSNLRMPESGGENTVNVTVHCDLEPASEGGYIGVVNAKVVRTQFGRSPHSTPDWRPAGLSDQDYVFKSDSSTLHGIIDRQDEDGIRIIWAGPPICKITDSEGRLLYYNPNKTDPAIFDVLEDGQDASGQADKNRTSAFRLLRNRPQLYYAPEEGAAEGAEYTGTVFCVKMLIEEYTLTNQIQTLDTSDMTITLTTAGKDDDDDYPFDPDASGTRATIMRGSGVTGSMVKATTNMIFENILLDGENVVSSENGGIIQVAGTSDITVEIKQNAFLRYGKAPNGGAIAVNNGNLTINRGLIRFCEATANGGAIYLNSQTNAHNECFRFIEGNIQLCKAVDGAGVYVNNGVFSMSGGTISGCEASRSGGGVFVADNKTMRMSGGRVGYESANTAGTSGGGIAVGGNHAVLHFSGTVNVSKNTCSGHTCNVRADWTGDVNTVIQTQGLRSRSYIGVYVPGKKDDAHPNQETAPYAGHGRESEPFGYFEGSNTQLYCFVNDRNGLKGGVIAEGDPNYRENTIYWIKIFSIELSKEVDTSENIPDSIKNNAEKREFKLTIRLWDTDASTVSGITVADIADDIAQAKALGEDSRYGDIDFVLGDVPTIIVADVTVKSGDDPLKAENLPDGLGYDVTEEQTPGYVSVPKRVYTGTTGENKNSTDPDVNPYVSDVKFTNIFPICKITDTAGEVLYYDDSDGNKLPAVYTDLDDAFNVLNGGSPVLHKGTGNVSYSGDYHVEMLVSEYWLKDTIDLTKNKAVTFKTAPDDADDNFPYQGSGVSSVKRHSSFTSGSMINMAGNTDLTLTDIKLDGNKVEATVAKGGIVYVPSGSALTVTDGAVLQNSRITGDGAGVYLKTGSTLNLSGDPMFGGTDTDAFEYLFNTVGNFKIGTLTGKKNGGKNYTVAHQDIYLEENHENAPASIVITDNLTHSSDYYGSIWVWAEHECHYKTLMPFAVLGDGVTGGSLKVFRDARPDDETDNNTGSYLYGTLDNNHEGYVCWNGIKGNRKVVLRKVKSSGGKYHSSGATFNGYTDEGQNNLAKGMVWDDTLKKNVDVDLSGLHSSADTGGAFFAGRLNYGTYYLSETSPSMQFEITVNENGAGRNTASGLTRKVTA